jgi:GTPase SAR1 family protein
LYVFPHLSVSIFSIGISLFNVCLGYNVETIKLHCHHLCHRQYHKITLWDCGGQSSVRSLWSYHYLNTSLLLWLINIHDRSRLDGTLQLLSQILTNPLLFRVPVLIVLYNCSFDQQEMSDDDTQQNLLTNLEVAFRFLATLSTSRASTFKWQVINVTLNGNDSRTDLKKIRQCLSELMEL